MITISLVIYSAISFFIAWLRYDVKSAEHWSRGWEKPSKIASIGIGFATPIIVMVATMAVLTIFVVVVEAIVWTSINMP